MSKKASQLGTRIGDTGREAALVKRVQTIQICFERVGGGLPFKQPHRAGYCAPVLGAGFPGVGSGSMTTPS